MVRIRNPLAGTNLNLFVVFDALLRHRSGTRAAQELGVTPSAISHALRELRQVFADPLFVRSGSGLTPTHRASSLEPSVQAGLRHLEASLHELDAFDPSRAERRFRVATNDGVGPTLIPAFASAVMAAGGGLVLEIQPRRDPGVVLLEAGRVDLVLELATRTPSWVGSASLYSDTFVCLVRADHPFVGDQLDLETYAALDHVRASPEGYGKSTVDEHLTALGVERRIAAYVGSFVMATDIVAASNAIITLPAQLAKVVAARTGLRTLPTPLPYAGFTIDVVWDATRDDAGLAWLRDRLHDAAAPLQGD